jgi:hypothetical protein
MKTLKVISLIILIIVAGRPIIYSQNTGPDVVAGIPVNYDETLTGSYTLPDPLIFPDGRKVINDKQWFEERRPQILALFEEYQYGKIQAESKDISFRIFDPGTPVLNGTAIRKQVAIYLTKDTSDHRVDLLIYLPAAVQKPVPLFFNVSFMPNSSVVDDPGIRPGLIWDRDGKRVPVQRSSGYGRMEIDQFLSQGIGFATVCYGDIEPDFGDGIKYGIRGYYLKDGQEYPAPDEWGAISAWSWGLSCAMDYFETDPQIESKQVALFGISRLGKTVLWTGARDPRFGMVIASCSGEGGAALSRRLYGETIDHMTHPTRYFYQFAGNWSNYKDDPSKSPVDANLLISLMAPRPLLLQTGSTDKWSDPKGEFLAAVAAGPVYELLSKKPLLTEVFPDTGVAILNDLGYYMHAGGHGAMPSDYKVFIRFMQMHFYDKVPGVVVDHIPATNETYIGSPSICILPNGDYIASHDYFGPKTTEHTKALTSVFRSNDRGKSWGKISDINGQFWSNLFVHNNKLYIMGTDKHHGNFIIRRSGDGGVTWSEPADGKTGLLLEGEYHTAPMPMIIYNGRIWRALENAKSTTTNWGVRYSAMVISAPVKSDLLDASNWRKTNFLSYDSTYLEGNFGGWLEGNAVLTPDGSIEDILRVATSEKGRDIAAVVNISNDGTIASFDPSTGFIDFIGGARKFSIRFDKKTRRYWTICNMITREFVDLPAGSVRNTLVLKSSPDLKNWTVHEVLLNHPDVKKHGFQYIDWQFEGKDIVFLSRTAFDDQYGGAHNYHDANFLTFHRIRNYSKLRSKKITL